MGCCTEYVSVKIARAMILIMLLAGCGQSPEQQAMQHAESLLGEGQLDGALAVVEAYLVANPAALPVRRQRVMIFLRAERLDLATGAIDELPTGDPVLLQALRHRDPGVRASASKLLINRPRAVRVAAIVKGMDDSSPTVRRNCARVAQSLKDPVFLKPLFRSLQDPDWQVRAEAADALGCMGEPRAAGWLIVRLRDQDRFVQFRAAQALRAVACDENRETLARALTLPHQKYGFDIAVALAKLGDERALGPLTNAVSDVDRDVRRRAAEALGLSGQHSATNALNVLLADADPDVRDQARLAWNALVAKPPPAH